jgi:outer membrane beta-barrel protein
MKKTLLPLLLLPLMLGHTKVNAEEAANATNDPAKAVEQKPEQVDISNLEEDYWRPNKDELEVVQNRRFEKKGRFETSLLYGFYQGKDYVNSRAAGVSLAYNITNEFFVDLSHLSVSNQDNEFLNSVRTRFGFTPDFNREKSQSSLHVGWTPIYAKFSLLGKKISHFEMYIAPGVGVTKTTDNHTTAHLTIGQKFFLTENIILRVDWRMSQYTDRIRTTQGSTSVANGGPGYTDSSQTTHNIIFGLGWMF